MFQLVIIMWFVAELFSVIDAFMFCSCFSIDRKSEDAFHKATKKDKEQMLLV